MRLRLPSIVRLLSIAAVVAACSDKRVTFTPEEDPPAVDGGSATCSDGTKNGAETDVDCGGSCAACEVGQGCGTAADCVTDVCTDTVCAAASCTDLVKNGAEADVDCGGACSPCATGATCGTGEDCASRVCTNVCQDATCSDSVANGTETDIDCGGSCGPCSDGAACSGPGDCTSRVCTSDKCQTATCTDSVANGTETDIDCGGSCGPCSDGAACSRPGDCTSEVCTNDKCQRATCTDSVANGAETDIDCGGPACPACSTGRSCAVDSDCASASVCDALQCRPAQSCSEIHLRRPAAADGVYSIAPSGSGAPFNVVCDMTRDGGGWTLLLKTAGDATFAFGAAAWIDPTLLNPTELSTGPGNAKYLSYLTMPVTTLRGELDGFRFTQSFPPQTAVQIFAGPAAFVDGFPTFNTGDPRWSTQPNCHVFGVNLPYFTQARFGWSANQENNCLSNDTAIGLGINGRGAGYRCGSSECSNGNIDAAGDGLLWGR